MNKYTSPAAPPAVILSPQPFGRGSEFSLGSDVTPFGRLGKVLRRRWLLMLCCAMTAAIVAGLLGLRMPRLYTGWAQVIISPQVSQARPGLNERVGEEAAMTIETQVSVLQSRDLMSRVLTRLVSTPGFPILDFGRESKAHIIARLLAEEAEQGPAAAWISAVLGPDWATGLRSFAAPPNPQQRREMIIDELLRNLKVNSEPRSRVVSVRYTAVTPELAALVTNTVIETYISAQKWSKHESIRQELVRLEKDLPTLHAELQAANAQIRAYRLDHAVPDQNSTDLQEQQAVALKGAIKAVDTELARTKADQAALTQLRDGQQVPPVSARYSTTLPHLQDEEAELTQRDPDPNAQPSSQDTSSPETDPAQIRKKIIAEADVASGRASDDIALLLKRRQALQTQLDTMQARLEETQPAADHVKELLRLVEAKRQLYEDGLLQQQNLLRDQDLVTADAAMLSAAAPPQKPTSTSPILFLPPALVAGLLVGGLIAIWRDAADDGLRSERLVPQLLGIPCAGFVPRCPALKTASADLAAGGLYAAALRFVFNATLRFAPQDGCRSILVTSSVSGEGSRELAQDLAIYAARVAPCVLLIDLQADRSSGTPAPVPARSRRTWPDGPFLESPIPGMILTQASSNAGLYVLRTDALDSDAAYVLLSRDLPHVLQHMREAYDCIVIHAEPVLEAAQARLLAGEVDHTLVAIRWGRTPRAIVENALAVLCRYENGPGKPTALSAVLTDVNVRRHLSFRFGDAIEALIRAYGRRASV